MKKITQKRWKICYKIDNLLFLLTSCLVLPENNMNQLVWTLFTWCPPQLLPEQASPNSDWSFNLGSRYKVLPPVKCVSPPDCNSNQNQRHVSGYLYSLCVSLAFIVGGLVFMEVTRASGWCTPAQDKYSPGMTHGTRPKLWPGLWNTSRPDPVRYYAMEQRREQRLTAHMTQRIHPVSCALCPAAHYQDTHTPHARPVSIPVSWQCQSAHTNTTE